MHIVARMSTYFQTSFLLTGVSDAVPVKCPNIHIISTTIGGFMEHAGERYIRIFARPDNVNKTRGLGQVPEGHKTY